MGCSHFNELNMFSSSSSSTTAVRSPLIRNPNTSLPRSTSLLALCNHQANGSEQSRTEFIGSSRWNPTPEQLLALEEMYRQGTRTPSADQIQHIATQLRRFGKIEGKNVFYWFQNHKARERQKRRREKEMILMNPEEKQHIDPGNTSPEYKKESGMRKQGYEVEQTKKWGPSSNCSKHREESISMHRGVVLVESGFGPHGWPPFDEKELHQRRSKVEHMNATWQAPSSSKVMDTTTTSTTTSLETKFLLKPYLDENFNNNNVDHDHQNRETQTLELFPLCRDDQDGNNIGKKDDTEALHIKPINAPHFTPSQFIEFLPLKN